MNQNEPARPIHFLLVEDDEDHAFLVKRAMSEHRIENTVEHVTDGEEALRYLRREGQWKGAPKADIVLLDLKLPRLSGHEVLDAIKSDKALQPTPVVVLTTSTAEQDRAKAYLGHANSYVVKPIDFDQFHAMVEDLGMYWSIWNRI